MSPTSNSNIDNENVLVLLELLRRKIDALETRIRQMDREAVGSRHSVAQVSMLKHLAHEARKCSEWCQVMQKQRNQTSKLEREPLRDIANQSNRRTTRSANQANELSQTDLTRTFWTAFAAAFEAAIED